MNAKMLLIHYPYGLRIVCVKSLSEDFIITKLNEHDYEAKSRWDKYVTVPYDSEEYKIVLHPLSHLTKPLKVKDVIVKASDLICKIIAESMHLSLEGEDTSWIIKAITGYFEDSASCIFSNEIMRRVYYILLTLHFDITGMIKRNEAISVEELKYDPYEFESVLIDQRLKCFLVFKHSNFLNFSYFDISEIRKKRLPLSFYFLKYNVL